MIIKKYLLVHNPSLRLLDSRILGIYSSTKTAEEQKEKYYTNQKKIDRLINKYDIKIQRIDWEVEK